MVYVLRKYKYSLDRQILMHIYKTFIRPVLEYAGIWSGCLVADSENLGNFQFEAARIELGFAHYHVIFRNRFGNILWSLKDQVIVNHVPNTEWYGSRYCSQQCPNQGYRLRNQTDIYVSFVRTHFV